MADTGREGGLEAPTRIPINQNDPNFWDEESLEKEMERVFDICHTCRRCVSLCNSFPSLFDLIDDSDTMEVDGVAKLTTRRLLISVISATYAISPSVLMFLLMSGRLTSLT